MGERLTSVELWDVSEGYRLLNDYRFFKQKIEAERIYRETGDIKQADDYCMRVYKADLAQTYKERANLCNFFNVEPTIFFAKKVRVLSEDDLNHISEIKRMLPSFEPAKLREIYNILLALQK